MAWHGHPGWQPTQPYIDPRFAYPGYGPPPRPQWYTPPDYYGQPPLQSPPATHARSSKYPSLNPVLAEDTTLIRFDIRQRPSKSIIAQAYQKSRGEFALATPTKHMRLVSKAFPWSIEIVSDANITCEDVWRALWSSLQENIVDSEWGFLMRDKGQLEAIEKAVKQRAAQDPKADKRPKRIDVLGDMTLFRGLERDDEFAKMRLLPQAKKCDETWVVKLNS